MVTKKKTSTILLPIYLVMLNSCTLFYGTIKVEVPKGYVGWCFVVPGSNSNANISAVVNGKYQMDKSGFVLIPASVFNIHKNHVLNVYEGGDNISDDMRYAGMGYRVKSTDKKEHNYIQFYLPSNKERGIPDTEQYWRDNMYKYGTKEDKLFDSLLRVGLIGL